MVNISFLIATYNNEKKIFQTINSASKAWIKSKIKYEIIIVDDCSKDSTYIKLRNYKKNKFLKIYKNKINSGFSKSIFYAATKAKGKNIKILHASNIENENDIKKYLLKSKSNQIVLTNFVDRRSYFRKVLSRFCSNCFTLVSGKYIKYFNSSLLCSRKDFLKLYPKNFKGNFFLSVIISKLLILNYTFSEVRVIQKHPKKGSKAVSLLNLISFFHSLIIVFFFRLFKQ